MARTWPVWGAGAAILAVVASCNASSLVPAAGPGKPPVVAASTPVPLPPPMPSPRPPQGPPQGLGDFVLSGEFTQGGWARGQAPAGATALRFDGAAVPLAADGHFFIAFDRDAGGAAQLLANTAQGRSVTRQLAISPRAWNIEHISLGPKPGTPPDPVFLRRREGELAQINAARALDTHSGGWRQRFIWPARGRISGKFGAQRIYPAGPAAYHSGIDIATGTSGTPFVAPADGVVILAAASSFSLEGRLLMIDHGMGLNSAFLHCSALDVRVGDVVRQGQVIGRIGMTGRATGPHLHWSLKWGKAKLDPLLFAGPM
jgi:murein DD-endopeptidase MepM/ murein hydrolase activator NlpD